jgi:hypothetical protein
MRLRTLFLASLSLAAPVVAPQPAVAQYWTKWTEIEGPFSYRIVAATREVVNGSPRTAVTWEVRNSGREVGIRVGPRAAVKDMQTKYSELLNLYVPETLEPVPYDATFKPGVTRFLSLLPIINDKGLSNFSHFLLTLYDPNGNTKTVAALPLDNLFARALNGVGDGDIPKFVGRWRTNVGTLLTVRQDGNSLIGSSGYVGAHLDYGPSYAFFREARGILRANLQAPGGAHEQLSSIMLSQDGGNRLKGEFTDGQHRYMPFNACKMGEDEVVGDHHLRTGTFFWTSLDRVTATPADNGKVQVDVTMRVWSVGHAPQSFQPLYAKGDTTNGWLERIQNGKPVSAPTMEPCTTLTLNYRAIAAPDEIDNILISGGPNFSDTTEPWDISAQVAAAARSGQPPASPSPSGPIVTPAPGPSTDSPVVITPTSGRPPAKLREYSNYGIWDMRIEELAPGPDGNWQAVVRVRDAAIYKVGLTDDGVVLTLFDEDGRGVQSIPSLFRASVTGPIDKLEVIPQTMWMEKGDEVRVRLFIRHSVGFKPVRVRVSSADRETLSRTFPFE